MVGEKRPYLPLLFWDEQGEDRKLGGLGGCLKVGSVDSWDYPSNSPAYAPLRASRKRPRRKLAMPVPAGPT